MVGQTIFDISCSVFAEIKHCDQCNYRRKGLSGAHGPRGSESVVAEHRKQAGGDDS